MESGALVEVTVDINQPLSECLRIVRIHVDDLIGSDWAGDGRAGGG